ncbi:Lrp/AsnC family transcriptional regulator, leucine-responsive regulatory protein [[Clostridium] aminophilum]|uniref:Lrp/AsnC family transcriptional regulator, leucine-responsive regulatory protein n=1 Tax=[Clostridium] aminophilum TaxID=1526 RepID=A0A1I0HYV4_9FIRM|nr:Lrp/AsnC family transcriptional regulator [[Clostridium] aminophilum]SET89267.1 Lrp/AsnC family transcriptional regulator, leucine-responsive regulatory protein [[Clostridium] aminophilum]
MDKTDIKIINILQNDCKTPTREIGRLVGLTAPAVSERINRLRDAGVIEGFHAQIDETKLGTGINAFIQVNVPPREYDNFCLFCEQEPSIIEHHHIVGLNNALLRIRVRNSHMLDQLLEKIRHYGLSNTAIELSTYFNRKDFTDGESD